MVFSFILGFISFKIFYPIFVADEIIIPYGIHPFDICSENPDLWKIIKTTYIFTSIISFFFIGEFIYLRIISNIVKFFKSLILRIKNPKSKAKYEVNSKEKITKFQSLKNSLFLKIGKDENDKIIYIPENRSLSKLFNYGNNWLRKNFKCYVSFYKATYGI